MKYNNRMQLLLLILSLIIGGIGTYVFSGELPVCRPAPMAQMAWWGGVYPEYCLPGAVVLAGEEDNDSEEMEPQVRIRFKYLTFLND